MKKTEVKGEFTLKINVGTVKASIVEINPARKTIRLKEAWEKE